MLNAIDGGYMFDLGLMTTGEKFFYGGIAGMAFALLLGTVFLVAFHFTTRRLKNKIESEFTNDKERTK